MGPALKEAEKEVQGCLSLSKKLDRRGGSGSELTLSLHAPAGSGLQDPTNTVISLSLPFFFKNRRNIQILLHAKGMGWILGSDTVTFCDTVWFGSKSETPYMF